MTKTEQVIQDIETNGIAAKGKKELLKYLAGERLTIRQMVLAKCYDCMGYFSDGRGEDCELYTCSLYPVMPYRKQGEKYISGKGRQGKPLSDEHKAKLLAGRKKVAG